MNCANLTGIEASYCEHSAQNQTFSYLQISFNYFGNFSTQIAQLSCSSVRYIRCCNIVESDMVYSWPAHSWAKWQKPTRNKIFKICEIDWSNLCLQHFDTLTGNKNAGNYFWKVCEITFNNFMDQILSNFAHLTPLSGPLWPFYILECSPYMNCISRFLANRFLT